MDDAVGADGCARWKARAVRVHPDGVDADLLGAEDVSFEVVTDHPGVFRLRVEHEEGVAERARFRLAQAELLLDLDVIEEGLDAETLDLSPLGA